MHTNIDRTKIPEAGTIPGFSLLDETKLSRIKLSNGIDLRTYRYKKLPVVQLYLVIRTGAYSDPVQKAGMTNLLSEMLDEGTKNRSALKIADDFDFLGTHFNTWASMDGCGLSMLSLREHLDTSLEVVSDVIQNPDFPENELTRIRQNVLTKILQEADQPNVLATKAFVKKIYGEDHPYGYPLLGTTDTVTSIERGELSDKYSRSFMPNNASIIIVGDIDAKEIANKLETALSGWEKGNALSADVQEIPDPGGSEIFLLHRPDAVQSQIRIGHRGLERKHKDYFPVRVMNQVLGGQFTSRINLNLREDKGYTYGASSLWDMRKFGGHFLAAGGFQGEYTDKSVYEIIKEFREIRDKGVTHAELESAKEGLIRSLPRQFETPSQIATQLANVALYDLPGNYYDTFVENVQRVSLEDVDRAAAMYIRPENVTVVVVGDADSIKTPLEYLGIGKVILTDAQG